MKSRIHVTGIGCVSPSGLHPDAFWENSILERSSIVNGVGAFSDSQLTELRAQLGVKENQNPLHLEKPLLTSLTALKQAMVHAGWTTLNEEDGFIFATTTGHVNLWEQGLMENVNGVNNAETFFPSFKNERLGGMLDEICAALNFSGKRDLLTTACAAGTHAIALATLWLETGRVKRCLVGATEVLSALTVEGFRCFQLLSTETAKPFNIGRPGINLAEGSAFLCLEIEGKKPLAEISGVGFSSDAYHMTAPHPEGKGSFLAMQRAIETAGLRPSDISWVHAHGTGSTHNDLSEGIALKQLFQNELPPVSSTKAVHGHTLAASGVLETVLCIQALRNQTILRTLGLTEADPNIPVNHPMRSFQTNLRHILKNTLGFGGSNGALVISRPGVNL